MTAQDVEQIFPLGEKNDAYAQYFTGQSYNALLAPGSVPVANITFEPCCRNNWHIQEPPRPHARLLRRSSVRPGVITNGERLPN